MEDTLELATSAITGSIIFTSNMLKLINESRCLEYKKANTTLTHFVAGVTFGGAFKIKIKEVTKVRHF